MQFCSPFDFLPAKLQLFSETPPQNPVNSFFFPAVPVIRIALEEIVVQ